MQESAKPTSRVGRRRRWRVRAPRSRAKEPRAPTDRLEVIGCDPPGLRLRGRQSVDHAIDLLGQHGEEAKLLAGGHSLLPIMKLRLAAPAVLVDLRRLEDLRYVRDE